MFNWFLQFGQWCVQNPGLAKALHSTVIHGPKIIERLSPESKAKLASIVRWGVERAARSALTSVLGEVGNRVVDEMINNQELAEAAKYLVERGVEVGVDRVLKEANIPSSEIVCYSCEKPIVSGKVCAIKCCKRIACETCMDRYNRHTAEVAERTGSLFCTICFRPLEC
jgi:hypothetical protein